MANTGVSHGEVKSIVNELECSPSKSQPSSSIYSNTSHAGKGGKKGGKKKKDGKASF